MEKNRNNIDDLFKKELGNYTETPPPAVWDALEKRLDGTPSAKPRTPFTWLGYFAMLVGLVLISVFVSRSISGNSNSTKGLTVNTAATVNSTEGNTTVKNNTPANTPVNNNQQASPVGNNSNTQNNTGQLTTTPPGDQTKNNITDNKNDPNHNTLSGSTTAKANNKASIIDPKNKTTNKLTVANNKKRKHYKSTAYAAAGIKNKQNKIPANTEPQPIENIYNSSVANTPGPSNKAAEQEDESKPEASVKQDSIDNTTKQKNKNTAIKPTPKKAKPNFPRFEAGIKGGYESGFDNDAAKKLVASPYIQYNITKKLAIMLQPAIKTANLSSRSIGGASSYYKVNNDGKLTAQTDSNIVVIPGNPNTTGWLWTYTYNQTHDSVVKTYVTGGTYVEFEVPVVLKYYITKQFSVYGGPNIVYSKLTGVTEHTYISKPVTETDVEYNIGHVGQSAPPPLEPLGINYTGVPYSNYTGPLYPASQGTLLRFGYMLGFSYEFHKNWLFDALIQQAPVAPNIQAGYNVNNPISAPYFRLTIGYKLIK